MLVAQDRMELELHEPRQAGWALTATLREPSEELRLDAIGCAVPLAEIYRKNTWEAEGA